MNILIVGAGKVGYTCTAQLSKEGHDLTLVDTRSSVLETVQASYDVITVAGNGASLSVLQEAGIKDMDVLIAVSNADEVNLLSCITAKTVNPKIICIARIRDPEYVEQAYALRRTFGLALVLNPERQAANEIVQLINLPGSLARESFAKARIELVELPVLANSRICNKKLVDLESVLHTKVLVCAVDRNGQVVIPTGEFVLREGDHIFVTASLMNLQKMLYAIGLIHERVKHVLIAGGGRLSYYLAQLLNKGGITATIIERDEKRCEELSEMVSEMTTIVHGDASSHALLESEVLSDYDAFVSCTGLDELNIVLSMYASESRVPVTITKLGRGENIDILNNLPIGPIVCPKDLCTTHIVRYVRAMQNVSGSALSVHQIANGHAEVLEFEVDANTKHIGEAFKHMPIRKNILIVSVGRGPQTDIANGNSHYAVGDTVVVLTTRDSVIHTINDIFER